MGFPQDLYAGDRLHDSHIGHVSLAGGGKAAVERYLIVSSVGVALIEEFRRLARRHGVATGWSVADTVYISNGIHFSN